MATPVAEARATALLEIATLIAREAPDELVFGTVAASAPMWPATCSATVANSSSSGASRAISVAISTRAVACASATGVAMPRVSHL